MTATPAQTFHAKVSAQRGSATLPTWGYELTSTAPVSAYDTLHGSGHANRAFASANPAIVKLYAFADEGAAVGRYSYATAGWILDDVVYSGPAPNTPLSANLQFDITAAGTSGPGASEIRPFIKVYNAATNAFIGQTSLPRSQVAVGSMQSSALTGLVTGTTYRFEIQLRLEASAHQSNWQSASATVQLSSAPMNLPAGITVDSAQGNIVTNTWTPSALPTIAPELRFDAPVLAGQNLDLNLYGGAPSVLTILAIGSFINPSGITFGPWAGLHLNSAWVFAVPFTDTAGEWTLPVALPASATGLQLAMQAAVFAGLTIDEVYSTNPIAFTVQ